ncbi:hypothetical protein DKT69_33085 [Micromonospora sicca]|uniref:Uncharacterized protein n=1 Tax=Micromonospora sicca TaxID=2202420 RepID=A0A317D269_9ACTN|nr:hypothetical protein DKT69_33085 [Micromonospora sp. 4G51]
MRESHRWLILDGIRSGGEVVVATELMRVRTEDGDEVLFEIDRHEELHRRSGRGVRQDRRGRAPDG